MKSPLSPFIPIVGGLAILLFNLVLIGVLGWAAIHFIHKYW